MNTKKQSTDYKDIFNMSRAEYETLSDIVKKQWSFDYWLFVRGTRVVGISKAGHKKYGHVQRSTIK